MSTYTNPQVLAALQNVGSTAAQTTSGTKKKSSLDMDDFLKLLVAQMTYQDPLGGSSGGDGSSTGFITQLAQITMLEQLSQISNNIAANQAYSMIGKYVYLTSGTNLVFGRVDGVVNQGGTNYLMVGGETYSMADIYAAMDGTAVGAPNDEVLKSAELIGKDVVASVADESGKQNTISGKVEKLLIENGIVYLMVGNQKVMPAEIVEVAGSDAAVTMPETPASPAPEEVQLQPESVPEGELV